MDKQDLWALGEAWERQGLHRRDFLRLLIGGASTTTLAGILAACGGDAPPGTATTIPPTGVASVPTPAPSGGVASGSPTPAPPATATRAGSAAPAAANAPRGGTLRQANTTEAKSFHPYQITDTASFGYTGLIYLGGLTKRDPNTLEFVGAGAERWTVSEDKKTYTFTLRAIAWSDGTPLTAADYLWTYEQAIKPENKFPYADELAKIEKYEAPDPRTLRITIKEALVVGLQKADQITPLPKHIWERLDWNDPTKNPQIAAPTVASGMWKLQEWKKDQQATFVANDAYYDGRPNIDTLVVRIYGTQALAFQALKAGEVDYTGAFQPADYKEAKALPTVTVYEWYSPGASWQYIGFNLRRPALQDPLVRRAICYATDRQGIIDSVVYGLGKPTYSTYTPDSPFYAPDVEHYDFDPQKSADLFKQAGYTLQGGKLLKDGRQLTLKLLYGPATSKPREGIATITQQQLQELGASVEVQALEFQAYLDALKKEPYDWDMDVLGWSTGIDPDGSRAIWSEANIPALNSVAYINKKVEDLYDQGAKEFDPQKRKAIYQEIQRIITTDAPYVFTYVSQSYTGLSKKVGGIVPTRIGIEHNMNQWFISK